jgi:hypothetical protein
MFFLFALNVLSSIASDFAISSACFAAMSVYICGFLIVHSFVDRFRPFRMKYLCRSSFLLSSSLWLLFGNFNRLIHGRQLMACNVHIFFVFLACLSSCLFSAHSFHTDGFSFLGHQFFVWPYWQHTTHLRGGSGTTLWCCFSRTRRVRLLLRMCN